MASCAGVFELPDGRRDVRVEAGTTVADAAILGDVILDVKCGNAGTCGGCAVDLLAGTFRRGQETIVLDGDGTRRRVPGCQTTIESGDWLVRVPKRSLVETGERVVTQFDIRADFQIQPTTGKYHITMPAPTLEDARGDVERVADALSEQHGVEGAAATLGMLRQAPGILTESGFDATVTVAEVDGRNRMVLLEPGDTSSQHYGVAVDVGTTTVALELVDLSDGKQLASASSYNRQVARADDVAARISFCHAGPEAVAELQHLIIEETINRLVRSVCVKVGIDRRRIARMAISGNTTMTMLALGVSPVNVGALPFQPATNRAGTYTAGELGLAINPDAPVDLMPGFHGYVGGDITSDITVSGMAGRDELALLIDIGTNGEMALGNKDGLIACACAAGPAFEGGKVDYGLRASAGAIEAVTIDATSYEATCRVIDDEPPHGICGSGLIDFLAEATRLGLVNMAGRFDLTPNECPFLTEVDDGSGGSVLAYRLVPAEATEDGEAPITISEMDVQELLQAKAAVFSGIRLLMQVAEKSFDDLAAVYLAGGFAKHINLANAIRMGLLPDVPPERYQVIGNGSLAGAYLRLVDRDVADRMAALVEGPRVIELNKQPDFMNEYTNALFLPHLDPALFPTAMTAT